MSWYKPSPPIVMPSETPIVLYCHANMLSFSTCFLISFPRSNTAVQLVSSLHVSSRPWNCKQLVDQLHDRVTGCSNLQCMLRIDVSTATTCVWVDLLAWVAFPPNARNANMRLRLHRFFRRYACRIQHCLGFSSLAHAALADCPGNSGHT
jgi:hypothetical protein